ncbi:MAG: 4-oxalomesaconate tautomerase [Gammaproteobacteria bacterium]|nr:4-oxalomesaconate tautomerase [Gammaproteobacteria bacterium]
MLEIPCTWMRGGTSKGAYFLKEDLPSNEVERSAILMGIMGSPDPRQIDGIGGADPLTSKVAIVSRSLRPGADIDYLFLQVFIDQPIVTDKQNCGNILAGVAQFAVEKGLVKAVADQTAVAVYMVNSDQIANVKIQTPGGRVTYQGDTKIDGVPGTSAPVLENFPEAAGATCGALLPTGNSVDIIDDIEVTCIDNGMPVVIIDARRMGISGYESREQLDKNEELKGKLESIRLPAGRLMNLGDVTDASIPKLSLVAPPRSGGTICTRTFIPHRCHASIGVLGAVSVATACMIPGTVAASHARLSAGTTQLVSVEHPIGETSVMMDITLGQSTVKVHQAGILRTARKLFEGLAFYPNPVEPQ